jgi:hypothetical protein
MGCRAVGGVKMLHFSGVEWKRRVVGCEAFGSCRSVAAIVNGLRRMKAMMGSFVMLDQWWEGLVEELVGGEDWVEADVDDEDLAR